jgi:hypothetical protein
MILCHGKMAAEDRGGAVANGRCYGEKGWRRKTVNFTDHGLQFCIQLDTLQLGEIL